MTDFGKLKDVTVTVLSVLRLALRILESWEKKFTPTRSAAHVCYFLSSCSRFGGLCSSPVVETFNIMAYPDLIAIYCLTGCHAAAEETYLLHSPQNEWGDGLGVS